MTESPKTLRARTAALQRFHGEDHPATIAARTELRTANAAKYITALVDQAPPLSEEQRARLAALLSPPGGGQHAA